MANSSDNSHNILRAGRYAYEELDRVLHERARLGLLTSLISQPEGLAFGDLKELCSLTDGNLNRHLAVLSEAGVVSVSKKPGTGRGQTFVCLTALGKKRFLEYVAALEAVVADAASARQSVVPVTQKARRWSPT